MALSLQQLRSTATGVEPLSLLPGQIAFNVVDKVIYVGDGTSFKTSFDGTTVAGVAGNGWYSMPMDFSLLNNYYVANPEFYGDVPTDQQVLSWSDALNHPIWTTETGVGGSQVYITTNAAVAVAPGATVSDKITTAIGVVSPDEGDVAIVTGLPDDVYEGLYFFKTLWVKGAAYAYPSASEVIYNNTGTTLGATVQLAINGLNTGLIATTAIANTANSTANSALSIASAALPRAGGTMTGPLRLNSTLVDGAGSPGAVNQVLVSTLTGVQWVSNAPGDVTGVTGTAPITVNNTDPQNPIVGVSNATTSSTGVVRVGTNIDVASGVISVKTADASNLGLVEIGTNIDVASGVISVKTADTANLGLVEVGTNIDVASGVISVKTATNTDLGLVQSGTNIQNTAGVISILNANTTQSGVVQLNDTTISTSTTEAATANAVQVTKLAADAAQATADAAVPRSSYVAGGDILVGTGAGTFGPLGVGNLSQILVVGPGNTVQWEDNAPGDVTGVTGTAPITVNNADPENPVVGVNLATTATSGVVQIELTGNINIVGGVINVPDASTTVKGAVQLNNTLSSSSTTEALTAAQGASLQSQIDALTLSNSVILAGGYDATTGLVDGVTSQGTLAGFADGVAPPTAGAENVDHYLICIVSGSIPSAMQNGDWLLSVETSPGGYAYQVLGVGARPASATYTQAGIVQLANAAAVLAGTSDTLAITPQALQDNVLDSVTTANSNQIASSTAVKTAYDAGVLGQTNAAAAQVTANAALPRAGGTMTGTITAQNVNVQSTYSLQFAGGVNGSLDAVTDLTNVTSSTTAASATAVKSAYDLANTANTTANAALPLAGGTMTGNITFQDAGEGVAFNGGSFIRGISDATGNTNNDIAASSTAVKDAYALADAALPKAGGTMTGNIVFSATQPFPSAYPDTLGAVYGSTTPSTGAGAYNVSIGYGAGGSLTSGQFNVQIGGASGDITSGSNNVAIGFDRNVANPAGDRQLAIGPDAYGYWLSGDSTLNIKPGAGLRDAADSLGTAGQVLSSTGSALQWVNNTPDGVLGVTGTAPITVDNTDPANPIIGASAASISAAGVVQLNNTVTSTSTTEAATANAVKIAYDAALLSGITSATTIYVNNTNGNDSTGERGTTKAFLTINAALAVALNDDTIFLSPGTFTENVTLTKGVTLIGTWQEQGIYDGTTILGNFVFDMVTPTAANSPSINHIRFISPNTSSAFKVLNNAQPEGITVISDCLFTQQGESSTTQFCFETVGTWTRSMYVRRATFDGNVKHAAGTASGATGGYLVLDDILGTGSATRHYNISTGTVEFRRPSNSISPVLQTGGVVQFTDCISGITPSDATTSPIFGGTNICYKGSAASVGTGTVYFSGWAPILGVINIGANMIYGWSALNVTPANLIISGSALAYTTAVPAAAAVVTASQQRPRFDLLTATSSVAAANQLATVLDSTTGTLYSVSNLDAGTY